jgi:hypothetical protein
MTWRGGAATVNDTHACSAEDVEANRDKPVVLLCVAHSSAGVAAAFAAIVALVLFAPIG